MLQKYHFYYRIFHNNILRSRTLLSWHNSPNIFASQFMQIENKNTNYNILFKSQKLCQRNQFSTEIVDGIYSFSSENANSSLTSPSPETPINNANEQKEKQQQQCSEATKKYIDDNLILETRLLEMGYYYLKKQLKLNFEKGKSGQKFFRITSSRNFTGQYTHVNFRKIPIPEDAYAFVRALDELIEELAAEDFEQKLHIQDPQWTVAGAKTILKLKTVQLICQNHKFQLELVFFPNSRDICLRLCAIHKIIAKEHRFILPLEALPWLRKQMAEMLEKFDGTKEIAKEAPAQIPQQFYRGVSRTPSIPNDISSGHNLNQKKMQNSKSKLDDDIRALFDFDDEDMENYRRIAARVKNPPNN